MVYTRRHFHHMDDNGFIIVDPWDPYATLTLRIFVAIDGFLAL
jgi:hypothetical protein